MRLESPVAGEATSSCNVETFGISSALAAPDAMTRSLSRVRPLFAGFLLTLAQIAAAVLLLAPEGPLSYRYTTLVQHDGYWFANIIDRGYQTIVPPINHKVMEVSNVAFFPAYPGDRDRAAHRRAGGCVGLLDLLFSFLRTLEPFTRAALFRCLVHCRTSSRVFSHHRLFGIAVSDGAYRLYLLEQRARPCGENLGLVTWDGHVGDANRRHSVCRLSSGAQRLCEGLERFARSEAMASSLRRRYRADDRGNARRDFLFRLLPVALGALGHVHAHAICRVEH